MRAPTPQAVANGERLVEWLAGVRCFHAQHHFREYLALRRVSRYRITEHLGIVTIELPWESAAVIADIRNWKPIGIVWLVLPLPWWRRGRSFVTRLEQCDVY